MSNMHLVTGHAGQVHVTANDFGSYNAAFLGKNDYVLDRGFKFSYDVIDNNTFRIYNGDLIMQGRHARLTQSYLDLTIDNGSQGYKRKDLIVARYTRNSSTDIEEINLVVIKGTPAATTPARPSYTEGDILDDTDLQNDMPLYEINIDGINITTVNQLFNEIQPYELLKDDIENRVEDTLDELRDDIQDVIDDFNDNFNTTLTYNDIINTTNENVLTSALSIKDLLSKTYAPVSMATTDCPYHFSKGVAVVYNNKIHILGSADVSNTDYSHKHYTYDGTSWTQLTDLPFSIYQGAAVVFNDEIHVFGANYYSMDGHYKYDGSSWTFVSQLPDNFSFNSAVVYNNEIHIVLGNKHYKYSNNSWVELATLPAQTIDTSCSCVFNNEIHLFFEDGYYTSGHLKYNGSTWSTASTLPYDFRYGATVAVNNSLYIIGGADGYGLYLYEYNGSTWRRASTLSFEFVAGAAVVYKNGIHILGGVKADTHHVRLILGNITDTFNYLVRSSMKNRYDIDTIAPITKNEFKSGYEDLTTVANTVTSKTVTFDTPFNTRPSVVLTAASSEPYTGVRGWTVTNVSTTGFQINVYRTSAGALRVYWIAHAKNN